VEIEVTTTPEEGARQTADTVARRRLIGAGLGGGALSLVPFLSGRVAASTPPDATNQANGKDAPTGSVAASASSTAAPTTTPTPTTTAAPKRPTAADVTLLGFSQSVEFAARLLYGVALGGVTLDDEQRSVLATIGQSHLAYGESLSGLLGRLAPNVADDALVTSLKGKFTGNGGDIISAARDLESSLVATHTEIIGQLEGTDALATLAAIVTVEARHTTVLSDMNGDTKLSDLLVDNEADAIASAKG
jgi:hypothetical protein